MKKPIKMIVTMIVITLTLTGCSFGNKIKGAVKNNDGYFDYLKNSNVEKISIQNIRDKSFKFLVTDEKAILNMYNLLSKSKVSETKSELDPDYIFQIQVGDEIKEFNYVVGAYDGNFYNDEKQFTVSKRLDESIIQNLSIIRKPRDFEYIYYNTILQVINKEKSNLNGKKVGIDIIEDVDCLKYIFSTDIEDFLKQARKVVQDVSLIDSSNSNEYDVVIKVKNRGHDTTIYKSNITVENKVEKKENYYYVVGEYEFKEWNTNIYLEGNIPKDIEKNW
ncbi:hypothetical protein [Clostridium sp.]|uniref:hypothetical protein n=1 Tax=Clostridium sp. TaxID=1506 RepID=UPI00260BBC62|nr:hypothetical protein [Clostridium sp.]